MNSLDVGEGVQISYTVTGTGTAVTCIACYDDRFRNRLSNWSSVLTFDHRGSGLSSMPDRFTDYSIDAYTTDLEKLTKHVGFDKSVIIAHAQGAYFAADYVLRNPDRVSCLVLIEPIIFSNHTLLRDLISLVENGDLDQAVRRLIHMFVPQITYIRDELDARVKAIIAQNPSTNGLLGLWRTKDHQPIGESTLSGIQVPTLLIGGALSRVRDTTHKPEFLIEGCSKWIVPGASHFVLYENPTELAEICRNFIEQNLDNRAGKTSIQDIRQDIRLFF